MRKIPVMIFLVCICFFSNSSLAYSEVNVLLNIPGIQGESVIDGHEGEIEILAWGWEITSPDNNIKGSSKAIVNPLYLRKYTDKASPLLILASLNGKHYDQATLFVEQEGDAPFTFLTITMSNVQVCNVRMDANYDNYRPTEDVTLVFSKICYAYTPQKEDGSADAEIKKCWDVEKNVEY